jgi:hypothetical protein
MRLHLAAIAETLVFDDVPIAVRLAVFLALRLPKKHDDASLYTNSPLGIKEAFATAVFSNIAIAGKSLMRTTPWRQVRYGCADRLHPGFFIIRDHGLLVA